MLFRSPIESPPLRKRREDIPLLVNHFIKKYAAKSGKKIESVSQHVMATLQAYHWPGNVRELENIIERAVIVSEGKQLMLEDWLAKRESSKAGSAQLATLEENERRHIIAALQQTNWRVSGPKGAAKILDINEKTLYWRMKKLGIAREK